MDDNTAARIARLTAVVEAVAWAIGKDLVEDCEPLAVALDALEESDVDPVAAPTVAGYFALRREEDGR